VKQAFQQLTELHPAIGRYLEEGVVVAIDGQILQDALFEPITPESEAFPLPWLAGGREGGPSTFSPTSAGSHLMPNRSS